MKSIKKVKRPASAGASDGAAAGGKKRKTSASTAAAVAPSSAKKSAAPAASTPKAAAPAAAASRDALSEEQVRKAVRALCSRLEGMQGSLLDDTGATMHLQIALNQMPKGRDQNLSRKQHKPTILALPHPARTLGECDVCLFTKDPQREYKDKLAAQRCDGRVKVIGMDKLRKKYVEFEAKRQLCASHDAFLADKRVLPMLPKLLGKSFFKKSKQPAAVDLTRKNVREALRQAIEGTRFLPPSGTLVSVLVGYSSQEQAHLVANAMAVAAQAVPKLQGGWGVVQAMFLKTADSVALPVYQRP